MKQRGRVSAAATAVMVADAPTGVARLQPLVHLSDAERAVWVEVVSDQPAEAFTVTHAPLLEMYCRHVVQSRILAEAILNFDRAWLDNDDGLKRYEKMLKMNERECRAASSIATRLRITRQSVHAATAGLANLRNAKTRKPWELPAA